MQVSLGHCVLFPCFRSEKNLKSNEGGGGGHLRKQNIEPIFGKVSEGDEIKKEIDIFLEKVLRATK